MVEWGKVGHKMDVGKITERLDNLIGMGEKVLGTEKRVASAGYVETQLVQQWRTSCLAFLGAVLGHDSNHYREFENRCKGYTISDAKNGIGILRAAKEDIEGGCLQKVEALVSASVFSDFLEMAEHLLDNGYKDPAASLTGAVLEDGLRHICGNNSLPVKSDDNINYLNRKIADKNVYRADDVTDMLKGARSFLSEYLK